MNFLAHLYLSGESEQILIGNFIADFLKGVETETIPQEIFAGVTLHRKIDSYTNNHNMFSRSKHRLWWRHRHYSAVIVDLIYDHFLAKYWGKYTTTPLEKFAAQTYSILHRNQAFLPPRASRILPLMISDNWLVQYREIGGVDRAMQGLARRTVFNSNLATAIVDLRRDYLAFADDFTLFFPQLQAHCKGHLSA